MSRKVTILGATGSVGRSTLDLIERDPDGYEIVALTARKDIDGLIELAGRFKPTTQGVWEWQLSKPVTNLAISTLTVSVADRQGNVTKVERRFRVGK